MYDFQSYFAFFDNLAFVSPLLNSPIVFSFLVVIFNPHHQQTQDECYDKSVSVLLAHTLGITLCFHFLLM